MADLQSFTIELTPDLADRLRRKVASGRYANESEAVSEALLSFDVRDQQLEDWLQEVVSPRAAEDDADPADTLTLEEVRASLILEPARRTKRVQADKVRFVSEVRAANDAWKADPSSGLSADDVRASIVEEHRQLTR